MTIPYKYRGLLLLFLLVVMLPVVAWRLALADTFSAWMDCHRLEKRLDGVSTSLPTVGITPRPLPSAQELILSGALIDSVRRFSAATLQVAGYLPVTTLQQDGIEIHTAQLILTGSFHDLLRSVQALEQHLPECRIQSLQWQCAKQYRTRKLQLSLTLYIQQLILKSDIR